MEVFLNQNAAWNGKDRLADMVSARAAEVTRKTGKDTTMVDGRENVPKNTHAVRRQAL
jgi:hypothetical protein